MLETIYNFLLHTFALIGLVLTVIILIVGNVIRKDKTYGDADNQDSILISKTDRELYDAEN